ncbi:MAG TPA: hypothetical protein VK280_18435 [Streptosporangiaceae bacterium]|nr:hypothetical protein [Streptosporangiaceae bacterium]
MGWFTTADTEEFLAVAGEYLRAEPARNSVVLTVTEDLRVKATWSTPRVMPCTSVLATARWRTA